MKHSTWKWIFGISLTVLILLALFTIGIWAMGNATAAMAGAIMGHIDPDNFGYRYLPLDVFLANAVGSPVFYIGLVVAVAFLASIVGLTVTKKTKETRDGAAETKA